MDRRYNLERSLSIDCKVVHDMAVSELVCWKSAWRVLASVYGTRGSGMYIGAMPFRALKVGRSIV